MVQRYVWFDDKTLLELVRVEFRTSTVLRDFVDEVAAEYGVSRSAMLNAFLRYLTDQRRRRKLDVQLHPSHVEIREVSRGP